MGITRGKRLFIWTKAPQIDDDTKFICSKMSCEIYFSGPRMDFFLSLRPFGTVVEEVKINDSVVSERKSLAQRWSHERQARSFYFLSNNQENVTQAKHLSVMLLCRHGTIHHSAVMSIFMRGSREKGPKEELFNYKTTNFRAAHSPCNLWLD